MNPLHSALQWGQQAEVQPAEWARRLGFVRGFARYRSATDPLTEVPPAQLFSHRSTRARPHLSRKMSWRPPWRRSRAPSAAASPA